MSRLHDHLTGKVKEEERIKELKKERQKEDEFMNKVFGIDKSSKDKKMLEVFGGELKKKGWKEKK